MLNGCLKLAWVNSTINFLLTQTYTGIMYKIIPAQLDWILRYSLNSTRWLNNNRSRLFESIHFSVWIANAASRFFWTPQSRLPVTGSRQLPIIARHTRKPIGVVPGRCMGLFGNTILHISKRIYSEKFWDDLPSYHVKRLQDFRAFGFAISKLNCKMLYNFDLFFQKSECLG